MRNPDIPLSKAFTNDNTQEILDLDWILRQTRTQYKLGTIYGGIESTKGQTNLPKFDPSDTDAASRLIDVYIALNSGCESETVDYSVVLDVSSTVVETLQDL